MGPEDEEGRAVAAGADVVVLGACRVDVAKSELLLVPADDDGREEGAVAGVANLTTAGLLPAWTAPASLSSSLMLLSEDVDMLSEEDDLLTSSDSSRLRGGKLIGFLGFSIATVRWWFFRLLQVARFVA